MLVGIVEKLINVGCTKFTSSLSEGIDLICASIVDQFKKKGKRKNLFLEAALPYRERLKSKDEKFIKSLESCNGVYVVKSKNDEESQDRLNYYLVNNSDLLVAVWDGRKTGIVFGAIEWANILKKEIITIPVEPYLYLK